MKKQSFGEELLESAQEMRDHARGHKRLRTTVAPRILPPKRMSSREIAAIRKKGFKLSQERFARALGVSVQTLRNWEQGRVTPPPGMLRLLQIAREAPQVLRALAIVEA